MPIRYDVFIGWGGNLGRHLGEAWHDDMRSRGINPFISSIEMKGRAGQDLKRALHKQIKDSTDAYVLVCTRGACFSEWVSDEIRYTQRCRVLIIPYKVNGHPSHPLIPKKFYLEFDKDNPDYRGYAINIRDSIEYSRKGIAQTQRSKRFRA